MASLGSCVYQRDWGSVLLPEGVILNMIGCYLWEVCCHYYPCDYLHPISHAKTRLFIVLLRIVAQLFQDVIRGMGVDNAENIQHPNRNTSITACSRTWCAQSSPVWGRWSWHNPSVVTVSRHTSTWLMWASTYCYILAVHLRTSISTSDKPGRFDLWADSHTMWYVFAESLLPLHVHVHAVLALVTPGEVKYI